MHVFEINVLKIGTSYSSPLSRISIVDEHLLSMAQAEIALRTFNFIPKAAPLGASGSSRDKTFAYLTGASQAHCQLPFAELYLNSFSGHQRPPTDNNFPVQPFPVIELIEHT